MRVDALMTRDAECIRPDAALQEAADRMNTLDVGSLPVCDDDRLVGVLTDRDIVLRSVSRGHDPRIDRVRDAMTRDIVFCFEDDDIIEVADLMRQKKVRRLPVLNRQKRLIGIISLGDLAVESGVAPLAEHALKGISEPSAPIR
jgi:CBS domain-containing protein